MKMVMNEPMMKIKIGVVVMGMRELFMVLRVMHTKILLTRTEA